MKIILTLVKEDRIDFISSNCNSSHYYCNRERLWSNLNTANIGGNLYSMNRVRRAVDGKSLKEYAQGRGFLLKWPNVFLSKADKVFIYQKWRMELDIINDQISRLCVGETAGFFVKTKQAAQGQDRVQD